MGKSSNTGVWNVLRQFWSADKITAWEKEVGGARGTETLANRISLASNVHRYWGLAMFALKPLDVSEDKKTLRAEFYWLPSNRPCRRNMVERPTIPNASSTGDNVLLFNNTSKTVISSGHII